MTNNLKLRVAQLIKQRNVKQLAKIVHEYQAEMTKREIDVATKIIMKMQVVLEEEAKLDEEIKANFRCDILHGT